MFQMETSSNFGADFERDGRIWLRNAISNADLAYFDAAAQFSSKAGERLPSSPSLVQAVSPEGSLMQAIYRIDPDAKPVRFVAFNKSKDANWGVPWHQDRVIAVAQNENVNGYKNWTKKSDIWHCEPPQTILEKMLFVRIHLNKTDQGNGAMEIAVGSHKAGLVPSDRAASVALSYPVEVCEAERGDVLILKMLTLHSSKPATDMSGRLVLRIDFASVELPDPLEWIGTE